MAYASSGHNGGASIASMPSTSTELHSQTQDMSQRADASAATSQPTPTSACSIGSKLNPLHQSMPDVLTPQETHQTGYAYATPTSPPSAPSGNITQSGAWVWTPFDPVELLAPAATGSQSHSHLPDSFGGWVNETWDYDWAFDAFFMNADADQSSMLPMAEPQFDFDPQPQLQQPFLAPPPEPIAAPMSAQAEPLTCPKGCRSTFGRPGDYRRHMAKHQPPKFKCMFIDCDKSFSRMDKLNDHFRQGHRSDVKVSRVSARGSVKKGRR